MRAKEKWFSRFGTVRSENLPAKPFCLLSARRSSFFTSPRHTTSCAIAASISSRRIFWEHQVNPWRIDGLDFAAVVPDEIRSRASSGHFAFERLKTLPRLPLAFVPELYFGIPGHRAANNRHGIFADRLIHIIFAIVLAADSPYETDRCHGAGTELLITISGAPLRSDRGVPNPWLFRRVGRFRMIENAGDGRECIVGRVALNQDLNLRILRHKQDRELRCQCRVPFLAVE